ncbi:hypothetical protein LOK49_LG07G01851 [Camellia lanceoleosa]|uniref:Uncharacterized protein n=1 Tax=Camellia lanceoleosa TaxID=1840588 RepID=A0ACC0H0Z8_9ERIC|nr:hypothetical protein LOK49_LG07G01851 [Camellia lanceoleosa]
MLVLVQCFVVGFVQCNVNLLWLKSFAMLCSINLKFVCDVLAATSSSHFVPSAPPPLPPPPPPAPAASVAPEDCGDTVREEACEAAQD